MMSKIDFDPEDDGYEPGAIVAVHVRCQGYPRCFLPEGKAREQAQKSCIWCDRVYIQANDKQIQEGPGEA